ncbi:hypothetical protein AB0H71_28830 [Nocardia sp. NPDC050697]|uniref:hypothetical protein n=1 Tax=Nocardia sp. NPDC050697 TaxID=3155158 RepID=UPI0033EE1D2B
MAGGVDRSATDQMQRDVAELRTDVAVVKRDSQQTKDDVREIKESIKAIMDGYVPTTLYLKDKELYDRELRDIRERTSAAQKSADAANAMLARSKPGIDLSNGIVKQLMYMFGGGVIAVVLLYIATQGASR